MLDKVVLVSTRTDLDGGPTALSIIQPLVKEQTANNLPQTCRYRLSQDKLELGGTAVRTARRPYVITDRKSVVRCSPDVPTMHARAPYVLRKADARPGFK
nr:hypothetical protein BaRGS_014216 [Batillaria attramentaria]